MSAIYGMRDKSRQREYTPEEMAKFNRFIAAERSAGNITSKQYQKFKKEFYNNQKYLRKLKAQGDN
jgi:hypothetical protein